MFSFSKYLWTRRDGQNRFHYVFDLNFLHTSEMSFRAGASADVRTRPAIQSASFNYCIIGPRGKETEFTHSRTENRHHFFLHRAGNMHQTERFRSGEEMRTALRVQVGQAFDLGKKASGRLHGMLCSGVASRQGGGPQMRDAVESR